MVEQYTHRPEWPIAIYAAVEGSIPFAPFVAYPMVPTVGKDGKRGYVAAVRCSGQTIGEARAQAQAWIDAEIKKNLTKSLNIRAGADKRRLARAGAP